MLFGVLKREFFLGDISDCETFDLRASGICY